MSAPYDPLQACLDLNGVHTTLTCLLAADKRRPLAHFVDAIEAAEELLNTIRDELAQAPAPSPAPAPSADPLPPAQPATSEERREAILMALHSFFSPAKVLQLLGNLPEAGQRAIYQEFVQPKPTRRITKIKL